MTSQDRAIHWLSGKIPALPELEKEKLGVVEIKAELARTMGRLMQLQQVLLIWSFEAEQEFAEQSIREA
jgi:hypothetical protein